MSWAKRRGGGGGVCASMKCWMASNRTIRILLVLLLTVSLGAFFPALAPLPALSSSPHRSHHSSVNDRGFTISEDMFWKDGRPFQIIGGDLHYFRIHPQVNCWLRDPSKSSGSKDDMLAESSLVAVHHYWEDRLLRAKALGLNTIQTYVPWNLHEPLPRRWVFEGIANIELFLKLAQDSGFLVMLRVGPYICGEWDLGGLPAWLLAREPAVRLRSSDPSFLQSVERWWDVLLPKIAPLLYENGGPIIMVQVENEYGSYGGDKRYLQHLATSARIHLGNDIILYTTDGGSRDTLEKGAIPESGVYAAVDFSTSEEPWPIFQLQKKFNAPGKSPPLSAEFYTGWLTHWGEQNAETSASLTATALQKILSRNGSAVLYMAHGGTNFGFFNGANTNDDFNYKADLTSYDYDAPIKESGDVDNPKFRALRNVIEKYSGTTLPPFPSDNERTSFGLIKVSKIASLFEVLDIVSGEVAVTEHPATMEAVGQMFGFLLYVSEFTEKETISILSIPKVHDRAQVFVSCLSDDNGGRPKYVGIIERWSNSPLAIPICSSYIRLHILVENMGRVNYGSYMYDRKGILSSVTLDDIVLRVWKQYPISFHNLSNLSKANRIVQAADSGTDMISIRNKLKNHSKSVSQEPAFYEGRFFIDPKDQLKDTFISFRGWNKGVVFVNDFNLGRFWPSVGPQCTLYVPAPILQHGENVVVIFELHEPNPDLTFDLVENPDFTCGSKTASRNMI